MAADYMDKHYAKLVGKTVVGVVKESDDREAIYGIKFNDGTIAWVLCDTEGNGPGFLDYEECR